MNRYFKLPYPLKVSLIHVCLPLFLGTSIYHFGRSGTYLYQEWFDLKVIRPSIKIPNWMLFNLPDFLWLYAFSNLMLLIWNHQLTFTSLSWVLSGFFIAVFSEVLQGISKIPGTFDTLDLLAYLLAIALTYFNLKIYPHLKIKIYEKIHT